MMERRHSPVHAQWDMNSLLAAVVECGDPANDKAVDGGLMPDANGKDPNPGGQTEGSKWQRPRITRKSLMKCCLVKWIIASTTQQGPALSESVGVIDRISPNDPVDTGSATQGRAGSFTLSAVHISTISGCGSMLGFTALHP
eukprot:superscaffoldBa00001110_g9020